MRVHLYMLHRCCTCPLQQIRCFQPHAAPLSFFPGQTNWHSCPTPVQYLMAANGILLLLFRLRGKKQWRTKECGAYVSRRPNESARQREKSNLEIKPWRLTQRFRQRTNTRTERRRCHKAKEWSHPTWKTTTCIFKIQLWAREMHYGRGYCFPIAPCFSQNLCLIHEHNPTFSSLDVSPFAACT